MVTGPYSQYSYVPANALAADTDYLPILRAQIKSDLSYTEGVNIMAIDIRSASSFTVQLSNETKLTAMLVGDVYVARYMGAITKCVPVANVTAISVWCAWER